MKGLFVLLSITAASASNLRGPVDLQATDNPQEVPLPDAACFRKENTVDNCEQVKSSTSRSNCVWCETKEDGGICLSNRDAKTAVEFMSVPCPNYTNALAGEEKEAEVATATAVGEAAVATPLDSNCFHSAWQDDNAQVTCSKSKANDDSQCVWCSMSEGNAGACLSNDQAVLANGQFGLVCPPSIYISPAEEIAKKEVKSSLPDINCFKAAWVADNAESACGESKDKDGGSCIWCQANGDAAGACLSKAEAGSANGQFGLACPNNDGSADDDAGLEDERELNE